MDIFFKYLNIIQFKHLTDADGLVHAPALTCWTSSQETSPATPMILLTQTA